MRGSILLFLLLPLLSAAIQPEEVRKLFRQASQDEAVAEQLIKTLSSQQDQPVLQAYFAATTALLGKYALNPYTKLSHCKQSSEVFQKAIAADPGNVEIRYLRLAIQLNLPRFLGMSNDLEEDRRVILQGLPFLRDISLRNEIAQFLLAQHQCTRAELVCCLP